jgi:hypothetical protein
MNRIPFLLDTVRLHSDARKDPQLIRVSETDLGRSYMFRPEESRFYTLRHPPPAPFGNPYAYHAVFAAVDESESIQRMTAFIEGAFETIYRSLSARFGPTTSEWSSARNPRAGCTWNRPDGSVLSLYDFTHIHKHPPLFIIEIFPLHTSQMMKYGIIKLPSAKGAKI